MEIRVLVVGDQGLSRKGLIALLREEPGIKVVGEARESQEGLAKAITLRPEIVLVDATSFDGDVVKVVRAVTGNCPQTRVLVLSRDTDLDHFRWAMSAGAAGYELMDISPTHLADAIRSVAQGKAAINQAVVQQIAHNFATNGHAASGAVLDIHDLTRRELQILTEVAHGLGDKEIAAKLLLSEATVKTHLRIVFTKLQVRNRAQAATFAVQHRLICL